jgi:general secretion pathway protein H
MTPRTAERGHGGAKAGFALLEFLIVLAIVGMVAATVGATMARRDTTPSPLESATKMQSMLLRARSDAIVGGTDTFFVIDAERRQYAYPRGTAPLQLPEDQEIRMVAGGESGADDGAVEILFRADGSSSGAEILLTNGRSAEARIEVNWLTGVPLLREGQPR